MPTEDALAGKRFLQSKFNVQRRNWRVKRAHIPLGFPLFRTVRFVGRAKCDWIRAMANIGRKNAQEAQNEYFRFEISHLKRGCRHGLKSMNYETEREICEPRENPNTTVNLTVRFGI